MPLSGPVSLSQKYLSIALTLRVLLCHALAAAAFPAANPVSRHAAPSSSAALHPAPHPLHHRAALHAPPCPLQVTARRAPATGAPCSPPPPHTPPSPPSPACRGAARVLLRCYQRRRSPPKGRGCCDARP